MRETPLLIFQGHPTSYTIVTNDYNHNSEYMSHSFQIPIAIHSEDLAIIEAAF